ncbi:MAG: UDP-N-acetylglucosamine diphosphorylase/glucosamine-1-phosphate N-acetyltransferase [Candidatus Solincola sediminis]|uniref:Bifunctional protein GlmU n=1 Tax=Candidatus Solincola sediminis TaxID=1797199 RepID=A0A1F2WLH2_9ACTN|nr:MAG: UDP-N-acetylglucosamine diphosphorylase/glucosamine-1-phosphate N-acetyltransferase [Candidatus Solincola sediminis]
MSLSALVLAAGEGTRMKSRRPKVMHTICGKTMISWVLDTLHELQDQGMIDAIRVVIGSGVEAVSQEIADRGSCIIQEERKGTGHAVMVAAPEIDEDELLVLTGDCPLIAAATISKLYDVHRMEGAAVTLLGTYLSDPTGYGRILRGEGGGILRIVEETEAFPEELSIGEVNTSTYIFNWKALKPALNNLNADNSKGEYFLTDVLELLIKKGERVAAYITEDDVETLGINSREHLAMAEAVMRDRINSGWMERGVTMEDPSSVYIGAEVKIGMDTVLKPFVILEGKTRIGEECVIGPGARIRNSEIHDGVVIEQATVRECELEDGVTVGPYASLRPGSRLLAGSKVGTFVETKKTIVGKGSKVPHLSYMGDAEIGDGVNVGAGSITCNYDGAHKYATVIEEGAFIGSDTMFIAPVRIGKGAVTAAGSAISKDVPDGALGVERGEQKNIPGWKKKSKRREDKEDQS